MKSKLLYFSSGFERSEKMADAVRQAIGGSEFKLYSKEESCNVYTIYGDVAEWSKAPHC